MRLVLLAVAAALLAAAPAVAAQAADSLDFAPGLRVSRAQAAAIDSIVKEYRREADALRLSGRHLTSGRTSDERHALHEDHRQRVRGVLTEDQRARYDAWYAGMLARREGAPGG